MQTDRTIGRVVKVKTYQALVELSADTTSYVKSTYSGLYAIGVINSFVIIPVASERVVAIVTALDMAEEPEATLQNRQMLVIPRSRRTMWISMIGTITQGLSGKCFTYGIERYPELDNPVWCADKEDLDVIFGKGADPGAGKPGPVPIGTSPLFSDYEVTIDIDRFFGKHAAVLGNTGSGKSCTVTAIVKSVIDHPQGNGMTHAHFIIFDTNNEYETAFTLPPAVEGAPARRMYNRLVLRNVGDHPTGLWVPHWFMNSSDYLAFFRPGEGAQGPLLFRAIASARAESQPDSALAQTSRVVEDFVNAIDANLSNPSTQFRGRDATYEQVEPLGRLLAAKEEQFRQADRTDNWQAMRASIQALVGLLGPPLPPAGGRQQFRAMDAVLADQVQNHITDLRAQLATLRAALNQQTALIGVDSPVHFDFDHFVTTVFEEELSREARRNAQLRNYIGTLQLRLDQARQDPRYAFLFKVQPFSHALASFLRLLFGEWPAKHFGEAEARPPWADYYEATHGAGEERHQVTIVDLSQLASEVLENVTALIGRLILEFLQRCPDRGSFPVVLILEEAHHYIAAEVTTERQRRAREVFEKIAKEGRKFGLSLVVASQRPSELSRTVLAQCNSFIVHRIQNPDDQDYFRSVISGINRELLEQLPALPQQHALVLGDCVRLPLQVRIKDVSPRPNSFDPEFSRIWSDVRTRPPDFESICDKWQAIPAANGAPRVEREEQENG